MSHYLRVMNKSFSKVLENDVSRTLFNKILLVGNNFSSTRPSSTSSREEFEKSSGNEDILYGSLEIEIRSGEPSVLQSYEWFALFAAKQLGITVGKCYAPPKAHHNRLTLLKSVHIYKKHRVQYEVRTYFRHMTYERLTESTLKTFLEYIQRNVPEGVALKVTKKSLMILPSYLMEQVHSVNFK